MINNSALLFQCGGVIRLLWSVPSASHMECRIERWKIHIGQHRCVSCVLSVVYDVLLVVGPDGAVEGDSSDRYGGFCNDQGIVRRPPRRCETRTISGG